MTSAADHLRDRVFSAMPTCSGALIARKSRLRQQPDLVIQSWLIVRLDGYFAGEDSVIS